MLPAIVYMILKERGFDGYVYENCITKSTLRYFGAKCRKCNGIISADERFIGIHFKCNDAKKPYVGYG